MSTRCTIGYDKDFHIFEEICDSKKVWIQLDPGSFEAEFKIYKNANSLVVGIDIAAWRKIVEAWNNSSWAKDPSRDYSKPDEEEFFSVFDRIGKIKDLGE